MRPLPLIMAMAPAMAAPAQDHAFGAGYRYLYAPQWDKAIQASNLGRPFLEEPQPLLMHGTGATWARTFRTRTALRPGVEAGHAFFRSRAENPGLTSTIRLNMLRVGLVARYTRNDAWKRTCLEAGIGITGCHLARLVNGARLKDGDEAVRAMGLGADLRISACHRLPLGARAHWGPCIGIGFAPVVHAPNAEAVLNQTRGLVARPWTTALTIEAGLRLHLMAGHR